MTLQERIDKFLELNLEDAQACLEACKNMADPVAEIAEMRRYIAVLEAGHQALLQQRNQLLQAALAAKAFGSQGENEEGISVSYLLDTAIGKCIVKCKE